MRINHRTYLAVGFYNQRNLYYSPNKQFFIGKDAIPPKKGNFGYSSGSMVLAVLVIRGLQAALPKSSIWLLLIGSILMLIVNRIFYLSIYKIEGEEVEPFSFRDSTEQYVFAVQEIKRVGLAFLLTLIFLLLAFLFAYLYLKTNLFINLLLSLASWLVTLILLSSGLFRRAFIITTLIRQSR